MRISLGRVVIKSGWGIKHEFMLQNSLLSICVGTGELSSCHPVCVVLLTHFRKAVKDLEETCHESKMHCHFHCELDSVFTEEQL